MVRSFYNSVVDLLIHQDFGVVLSNLNYCSKIELYYHILILLLHLVFYLIVDKSDPPTSQEVEDISDIIISHLCSVNLEIYHVELERTNGSPNCNVVSTTILHYKTLTRRIRKDK